MSNENQTEQDSKSSVLKKVCIVSTIVIALVLVVLGLNYRFIIRREADHIITGN